MLSYFAHEPKYMSGVHRINYVNLKRILYNITVSSLFRLPNKNKHKPCINEPLADTLFNMNQNLWNIFNK